MNPITPEDIDARLGKIKAGKNTLSAVAGGGPGPAVDAKAIEADPVVKALRGLGRVLSENMVVWSSGDRSLQIECPWSEEHTGAAGGTFYVPVAGKFKCHHGHCEQRGRAEFLERLGELLTEDSGGLVDGVAALDFPVVEVDEAGGGKTAVGRSDKWKMGWQHSGKEGKGGPTSNLYNVMVALQRAPEFAESFGFNAFALREVLFRELPGVVPGTTPGVPREWRDQDTIILQDWLQGQGLRAVTSRTVDDAVNRVMQDASYHPVRDWLCGLAWDGVPRLDTWLSKYLGTLQDPYHACIGRWWLMTMCRRVFEPGCRADYMPVLEGLQGKEKSSFLAALAGPPEWFSDQLPDIRSKDASDHLVGRWLVEIAEMDQHDRAENAAMKAFISRTTERYRRAYARRTQNEPRQCVFVGTVNHVSYLKDETGNRRYWPFSVGKADIPGLVLVRDQLFAEAWDRAIVKREQYWPDPLFEELFIEPEQDQRLEPDLWEHTVAEFLSTRNRVEVHEVVTACTGGGSHMLNTTNRNRVTRIMETLKWKRGKRGPAGERFWYPG